MTRTVILRSCLTALMLLPAASWSAQPPPGAGTMPLLVITTRLKPDHLAQWIALQQREVLPALRKAGVREYTVYETVHGDTPEYTSVRPLAGFGEFDAPDALERALGHDAATRLRARLCECVQSGAPFAENRREFYLDPRKAVAQYASKYRRCRRSGTT
jgi:hypothetical protein